MDKAARTKLLASAAALVLVIISGINFYMVNVVYPPLTDECLWVDTKDGILFARIDPDGVTDRAGIKTGDILEKINGEPVAKSQDAQVFINQGREGQPLRYTIRRGDQRLEFDVPLVRTLVLNSVLFVVVGVVFLLTGYLVLFLNPLKKLSRYFFYFCFVTFGFFSLNVAPNEPGLFQGLVVTIRMAAVVMWGPAMLHFFTVFPLKRALFKKHPRLVGLMYLASAAALAVTVFVPGLMRLMNYVIGCYIGLSFFSFFTSYAKIKDIKERKALRIVLWGMCLGLLPLGLIVYVPGILVGLFGNTGVLFGLLMVISLPLAFGYAVMKYGLMDVDIVVKKSISYSITTGFFILLYMGLVVGLGGALARKMGIQSQWLNAFFVALVALALNPVNKRVQRFVDHRFYPKRYTYRKMLLELSRELPTLLKLDEILNKVSDVLKTAMQAEEIIISAFEAEKNAYRIFDRSGVPETCDCDFLEYASGLGQLLVRRKDCIPLYKIDDDPELSKLLADEKEKIEETGLVLAIPLVLREKLTGMILLGGKRTGDVYSRKDMDLLLTVAAQAAVAVENARLHLRELDRQRAEEELKIARRIQQELLPKAPPDVRGLEITGCSIPAMEVGGDYFDYILQSDNRFLAFVGDVSGKGMPAALYMSKVQGMIQVAGSLFHSPKDILVEVNRKITEGIDKKSFITMLAVLFDLEKQQAVIARAGHTPLFVAKSHQEKAEVILPKGIGLGIAVGNTFDSHIEEVTIPIQSGDCYVLFSDGLTEAMNSKEELFGDDRVRELVDHHHNESPQEIRDLLVSQAGTFRGDAEQNDDITVVVVKVK